MASVRIFPILSEPIQLNNLDHILRDLPADNSDATIRNNFSLVQAIGQPANIIPVLRDILNDREALLAIAGRSYRHVNHFDKIVLVDSPDQQRYRLTLHLWSPPYTESELNDELIHDHRFSFWSTLLTGDLVSENFQRSETGHVFRQYQYVPERQTLSNFYRFMGEVPLLRSDPQRKQAGETYYLYYETTHRVLLPLDSMTCTLVLRGPRLRNFSNVYNTAYPSQNTRMTNTTFSEEQLRSKVTALVENMESTRLRKASRGANEA
jgi:hypothetical protein